MSSTTKTIFCKDCVFAKRSLSDFILFFGSYEYAKCTHPSTLPTNFLITGKISINDYNYCATERKFSCGRNAIHFKPKKGV